ncbi:unnamed protein product [Lactuca virosa]|uniref:Uncharacterized protein n=1 Tax=Lactuca virosa TaxID=75947 RepID=A0AAU9NZF0_9ASTR|nr:unnamed protein product [Lactuca virosa]
MSTPNVTLIADVDVLKDDLTLKSTPATCSSTFDADDSLLPCRCRRFPLEDDDLLGVHRLEISSHSEFESISLCVGCHLHAVTALPHRHFRWKDKGDARDY